MREKLMQGKRMSAHRGTYATALLAVALAACADASGEPRLELGTAQQALGGGALPGLSPAQNAAFLQGQDAFEEVEGLDDGLGPVFNEKACGNCHDQGAIGGPGNQFEVRAGRLTGSTFDPLIAQGGQLFDLNSVMSLPASQRQGIPNCALARNGEPVPANANVVADRRTTGLFGLGLVDATPDSTFAALAAAQPAAIRGRVAQVFNIEAGHNTMGKFGWKAQVPTLHQFSGDAYLNEMGITNPEFPTEQPPLGNAALIGPCDLVHETATTFEDDGDDVENFTNFMSFLAPIAPAAQTPAAAAGDVLFTQLGCDGCHRRTLTTDSNLVDALSNQTYHPFSDFLLHDMGSLGDNIGGNGDAGLREMRTAPLWGLRTLNPNELLHDGRAHSLDDAIAQHDGQGAAARDAFNALSGVERSRLRAFLNTL
jgi:CxxC motif-containing protein (DUF1111 family)